MGRIRAGRLRHKVEIESDTATTQDEYGEVTKGWAGTQATVWASVEPLDGDERLAAHQVTPEVDTVIRCHYVSGVTERMRVKFGTRLFNIKAVLNQREENRTLKLLCVEARDT